MNALLLKSIAGRLPMPFINSSRQKVTILVKFTNLNIGIS